MAGQVETNVGEHLLKAMRQRSPQASGADLQLGWRLGRSTWVRWGKGGPTEETGMCKGHGACPGTEASSGELEKRGTGAAGGQESCAHCRGYFLN